MDRKPARNARHFRCAAHGTGPPSVVDTLPCSCEQIPSRTPAQRISRPYMDRGTGSAEYSNASVVIRFYQSITNFYTTVRPRPVRYQSVIASAKTELTRCFSRRFGRVLTVCVIMPKLVECKDFDLWSLVWIWMALSQTGSPPLTPMSTVHWKMRGRRQAACLPKDFELRHRWSGRMGRIWR